MIRCSAAETAPDTCAQPLEAKGIADNSDKNAGGEKSNLASGLFSSHENDAKTEVSSVDAPPPEITALADLLTTLPKADRAELLADMPLEQRRQIAQLLAKRLTENSTNEGT